MKSGKQRRGEIMARRKKLVVKRKAMAKAVAFRHAPYRFVPVNEELLAPNNSYGAPDFVRRGYYVDTPFRCVDCGKEEVWTGTQQKWWYEVAKGFAYSSAFVAADAATRNGNGEQKRDAFIWRVSLERTRRE
jgi:Probable zinc-ribbon domain